MQRHLVAAVTTFVVTSFLGCNKTVTYVSQSAPLTGVKKGERLEWQLAPHQNKVQSFDVCFDKPDPCGDKHPLIHGLPDKPASCKVTADGTINPYAYTYTVYLHPDNGAGFSCDNPDAIKGGGSGGGGATGGGTIPCPQCSSVIEGGISSSKSSATKSDNPDVVGAGVAKDASSSGNIYMSCTAGNGLDIDTFSQPSSPTPNPVQIEWFARDNPDGWTVKFTGGSPCVGSGASATTFNPDNPFCQILPNAPPKPYQYNASVTQKGKPNCSSSGTVTIIAPTLPAPVVR